MAKDKGLLIFYDWKDVFEELPPDDCKALLLALINYKQNHIQPPEFLGSAKIAALMMFSAIDRAEKLSEAGRRGGKRTQEASKGALKGDSKANSTTKQNKTETKQYNTKESITPSANTPSPSDLEEKIYYGQYKNVLLTDEEYKQLQEEFPSDYREKIDRLSEYMKSTGKTYDCHYATIRSWARSDVTQTRTSVGTTVTPTSRELSDDELDELFGFEMPKE